MVKFATQGAGRPSQDRPQLHAISVQVPLFAQWPRQIVDGAQQVCLEEAGCVEPSDRGPDVNPEETVTVELEPRGWAKHNWACFDDDKDDGRVR